MTKRRRFKAAELIAKLKQDPVWVEQRCQRDKTAPALAGGSQVR